MFKLIEKPQQAFAKFGWFGSTGSGKTWSSTSLAIYLHKYIGSKKGVVFIDSEGGSDFVVPRFKQHDIPLFVDKTRTFTELIRNLDAAPEVADIVIIDSITHFWREWVTTYLKERRQPFLRIQDWGPLKETWGQYTTRYLSSKLHIMMCGRSANIFEDVEDDDQDNGSGKRKFKGVKVGTKMSGESETGYEPNVLIELAKVFVGDGGLYKRRAHVVKERFGAIDSATFDFGDDDPEDRVFNCFLPHIQMLNLGGEHTGIDASTTSAGLIDDEAAKAMWARLRRRDIALEEIEGLITMFLPGMDATTKSLKQVLYDAIFGTLSWTEIKQMHAERLEIHRDELRIALAHIAANAEEIPKGGEELHAFGKAAALHGQIKAGASRVEANMAEGDDPTAAPPAPDPDPLTTERPADPETTPEPEPARAEAHVAAAAPIAPQGDLGASPAPVEAVTAENGAVGRRPLRRLRARS